MSLEQANKLLAERKLSAACELFDAAETKGADADACSGGRWKAQMLAGNFAAAWRETDAIRKRGQTDPHRFWNGESLRGKRVMVRSLHGFGDAVQVLRYAPSLRELAAEVTYEVAPHFVPLATMFAGVDQVITWGPDAPTVAPEWDVQVEVMELPYVFRTEVADLPLATNYLKLPNDLIAAVGRAMGPGALFRVGLVWTGGDWNPERFLPAALLRPLLGVRDVEFWNLHREANPFEGMCHAETICGSGLPALAATIAHLDLVITIDTLAAHLAGALGKPAWMMLHKTADWRWMCDRDDTPWYPSLRLIRQDEDGGWARLIERLVPDLQKLVEPQQSCRGE